MAKKSMIVAVAAMLISIATSSPARAAAAQANAEKKDVAKTERIAIAELKKKLDSGEKILLIDVREDSELEEHGAIAGAIHIPVGDLEKRMKDIPKNVEIVFY